MANSLLEHKRINTTLAKAKALRVYVEPLLTKAKNDTINSRRQVFSYLQNKHTVTELFRDIAPKIADRPGGYTRIIKTGFRLGDNAEMCMIELVDFNELMLSEPKKEKKTTRRSRSAKKATDAVEENVAAVAEETTESTESVETESAYTKEVAAVEDSPADENQAEDTTEDSEEPKA
jgi:large subunit ribosomal protein L17